MAVSRVVGTALIDHTEFAACNRQPGTDFQEFGRALHSLCDSDRSPAPNMSVQFSKATVTLQEFLTTAGPTATTPFQAVGIGNPATILLRHVYTGRHGGKDMLLTSAVRDAIATFNMAPRAINLMPKGVRRKAHLHGTAATDNGTDLIYYVNALTAQSLTLTIDMAFDDFPDDLVHQIAGTITGAGAIPLFGPYNGVLLGVGTAIKLVSRLVHSLTNTRPDQTVHHRFDFEVAGAPIPSSGYWILSNDTLNHEAFTFDLEHGLVDKATNRIYDGDEPYIVVLLDGTRNDRLCNFIPTAASAALLARFLSQKEGSQVAMEQITDAFKLYSDFQYRREADDLLKHIAELPANHPDRSRLEQRRTAALANILEPLLKWAATRVQAR